MCINKHQDTEETINSFDLKRGGGADGDIAGNKMLFILKCCFDV